MLSALNDRPDIDFGNDWSTVRTTLNESYSSMPALLSSGDAELPGGTRYTVLVAPSEYGSSTVSTLHEKWFDDSELCLSDQPLLDVLTS